MIPSTDSGALRCPSAVPFTRRVRLGMDAMRAGRGCGIGFRSGGVGLLRSTLISGVRVSIAFFNCDKGKAVEG